MEDWFTTGFESLPSGSGNFAESLRIETGETRRVRFFEAEPFNVRRHYIMRQEGQRYFTCLEGTGEYCPLCAIVNNAAFSSFFSVIDYDEAEKDNVVKQLRFGVRAARGLMAIPAIIAATITSCDMSITCVKRDEGTYNFIPLTDRKEIPAEFQDCEPLDHKKILVPQTRQHLLDVVLGLTATEENKEEDTIRF